MKNILSLIILLCLQLHSSAQCIQIQGCTSNIPICDFTVNDADLWNETYWWDNATQEHNLADAPAQFSISVSDTCSGATLSLRCLLFLDLDGDGTNESVVDSWNLPAAGTVNYNNAFNPGYTGGEVRTFDERPVTADHKYRFALDTVWTGSTLTASIRWHTDADPDTYSDIQLPLGNGLVKWLFDDNQGNSDVCTSTFVVQDCKKPTVVCLNGLSVNIMPTGMINLWATDFLQYVEDNNTPANFIRIGIRKSGTGTGFPVDGNGDPVIGINFNCSELGTQLVELWAIDVAGNADFCETYVLVQDNMGNCPGNGISGLKICVNRWCDNSPVTGLDLNVEGTPPFGPPFSLHSLDGDGTYDANLCWNPLGNNSIPIGSNYTITVEKDDNPNNGVTVLDLIKMSNHILGLEPLPSPYAMIAADLNKSNTITAFDIVEGRKLITGAYSALPNNTSWRFIDADDVFTNPNNPFMDQIHEFIGMSNVTDSFPSGAFVAVKIGDVDCDGNPGFQASPDERSIAELTLPDAVLEAGETVEIPVACSETVNFEAIAASFSYSPEALEMEAMVPGNMKSMTPDDLVQPAPGVLNALWLNVAEPCMLPAGERLFTLHLRARKHLRLSEEVRLTQPGQPYFMASEYYDSREKAGNFQLAFRGFAVSQNNAGDQDLQAQPNPTSGASYLPLKINEESSVRLSVTDVNGRLLLVREQTMPAGMHLLEIPESVMPQPGCYVWKIETGARNITGKLIRN